MRRKLAILSLAGMLAASLLAPSAEACGRCGGKGKGKGRYVTYNGSSFGAAPMGAQGASRGPRILPFGGGGGARAAAAPAYNGYGGYPGGYGGPSSGYGGFGGYAPTPPPMM